MPSLRIRLFGLPVFEYGNQPVTFPTTKASALLAYLAMTPGRQSRDALAAFLWPELSAPRAHAALRTTLWRINRLVPDYLETSYTSAGLPDHPVWLDVREFERTYRRSRDHAHSGVCYTNLVYPGTRPGPPCCCRECLPWLYRAADLYTGEFMEGFSLRDSAAFDDWQLTISQRLRLELSGVLERLVAACAAQEKYEPASVYALQWYSMNHYNEEALRQFMWLCHLQGKRGRAIEAFLDFTRTVLRAEGYQAEPTTTHLYQIIKS